MTIKLTPETPTERLNGPYVEFRQVMEQTVALDGFGPADKVRLRWLLDSGRGEVITDGESQSV